MIKQSFRFEWNDKVFGCSFNLRRTGQYFGWVTVYDNLKEYEHPTHWTDFKNIPLKTDKLKSVIAIREFCKNIKFVPKSKEEL